MIPYNDLINRPELYSPLSSHKSIRNLPAAEQFDKVNLYDAFHSKYNKDILAKSLYETGCNNGYSAPFQKFQALVPRAMHEFCLRTDISEYRVAENGATGQSNWLEELDAINNDFLKYCYNLFKWNKFNPYRAYATVGDSEHRHQKKYSELLAHDIPTIDVWAVQEVQVKNNNFRYNNQIPIWQKSMNTRHFDRTSEASGLAQRDPNRASLETPVRGYDMSSIYKLLDQWKSDSWFGW